MDRRDFLAGGLSLAGTSSWEAPASVPSIGVVNLRACFDRERYARMSEVAAEITRVRDEYGGKSEDLRKRIAALADVLDKPVTPDFKADRIRQRTLAEYDLKLVQEIGRRRLREVADDLEGRVYREIRRVVALVAAHEKVDLVLRADEPPPREEGDPPAGALVRGVLYHAPAMDLTPRVLDRLNAEWKKAWTCKCPRKVTEDACPDCGARRP